MLLFVLARSRTSLPHFGFFFLRASLIASVATAYAATATHLRCEYATDPLGIDVAQPRLFWQIESDTCADQQSAWQVLVASSLEMLARDHGDLWDGGRVTSAETTHVRYAAAALKSSPQVFWKIRVWDRAGSPSVLSAPATWTMGLPKADEWTAKWICAPWASE